MDEEFRTMLLYKRIFLKQLFERQTDRILYGYDLKYAPARHLVKQLLIPPKTKIPKVKFVDIDGTLIQLEELDRMYRQAQSMLYMRKQEDMQWMREAAKWSNGYYIDMYCADRGDIYG